MFKRFENINTAISLVIGLFTAVQWLLDIPITNIILSVVGLVALWIIIIIAFILLKPWHNKYQAPLMIFKDNGYSKRTYLKTIFYYPFYEAEYTPPQKCAKTVDTSAFAPNHKITVIVEDDPVGYIDNCGQFLAFAINDSIKEMNFDKMLMDNIDEIKRSRLFFITTSTRRTPKDKAFVLCRDIGISLKRFSEALGEDIRIISKIDSCIRSNYEAEISGLRDGFGNINMEILSPSYIEQGRITCHGSQYIRTNDVITPLHKSEFADCGALSYTNSNLALWLEKRAPHIGSRKRVGLIDIDMLRSEDLATLANSIVEHDPSVRAFVVDCCEDRDLPIIEMMCDKLEESITLNCIYKFGPSQINHLVRSYNKALNNSVESLEIGDKRVGVFVAGSLSSITKAQIAALRDDLNTALVLVSDEEIESRNHQRLEKKIDKIAYRNQKNYNVILTTEFWQNEASNYPTAGKRDVVLSQLSYMSSKANTLAKQWFLFKGSDTALFTMIYGFNIRVFYYCGQVIPGVIHCKGDVSGNGALESFFIVGGNVGNKDLLVSFNDYMQKQYSAL